MTIVPLKAEGSWACVGDTGKVPNSDFKYREP